MRILFLVILIPLVTALGACGSTPASSALTAPIAQNVDTSLSPEVARETVLLVSLDDGSVIKQTIYSSADLCFKKNSDSRTTCLTQGAPVYDPSTNAVIGFEMIEDQIELIAKSD